MAKKKNEATFGYRYKEIFMGVFEVHVLCIIGPAKNLEDYIAWKHHNPKYQFNPHPCGDKGITFVNPHYAPIIWLPRYPRGSDAVTTLAHECVHAAMHVMRWAGIDDVDDNNEEVLAHMVGHIMREVLSPWPG